MHARELDRRPQDHIPYQQYLVLEDLHLIFLDQR
jgi:hypothetical protein